MAVKKLAILFLTLTAWQAQAGGPGTTGANFLKIPVGPRQVGMGDQGVALEGDVSSLVYNPASLSLQAFEEMAFMHNRWIEGMSQQFLAYGRPQTAGGAVGMSVNVLSVERFQGYDAFGAKTGLVGAEDALFSVSYSRRLLGLHEHPQASALYWGASAQFLRQRLESDKATAVAGDLGLLYRFSWRGVRWRAGMAARHLGQDLQFYESKGALPATLAAGLSATTRYLRGYPATFSFEARKPRDNKTGLSAGAEYWLNSLVVLRAGYRSDSDMGAGFRAGMGLRVRSVQFDYGFSLMGDFGMGHRAGLTVRFGAHQDRQTLSPQEKARQAIALARHMIKRKRYPMALLEVNRALEIDSSSREALELLDSLQEILNRIESGNPP